MEAARTSSSSGCMAASGQDQLPPVLLVADLLHPPGGLAVELLHDGATWVMAVVGVAPCQCRSPGGNQTTSPGRISSPGPPSRCAQPDAAVTSRV